MIIIVAVELLLKLKRSFYIWKWESGQATCTIHSLTWNRKLASNYTKPEWRVLLLFFFFSLMERAKKNPCLLLRSLEHTHTYTQSQDANHSTMPLRKHLPFLQDWAVMRQRRKILRQNCRGKKKKKRPDPVDI